VLIRLVWVGKTRNREAAALIEDYRRRLARFCPIEVVEVRDAAGKGSARAAREGKTLASKIERRGLTVALDETGREMTSPELARWLGKTLESRGEVTFLLGGPDGIPPEVAASADMTLSLSRLTFTHEMARVLLLEQLYRAFGILEGTPYHRA
jgi:23S rRNA (pseudouridine1915-N3)-methyltransferase